MPYPSGSFQITETVGSKIANTIADVAAALSSSTQGTLVGGTGAATTLTGITTPNFYLQLDGDPTPHKISVANSNVTGATIASAIQTAIQALTGVPATYAAATCGFSGGQYTITSGTKGSQSSVLVTAGATTDISATLCLTAVTGAVATIGTDAAVLASNFNCTVNVKSFMMVESDTAGNLYLLVDGTPHLLATAMVAGTPFISAVFPLVQGSYYNLAFSVVGARLKIGWISGV